MGSCPQTRLRPKKHDIYIYIYIYNEYIYIYDMIYMRMFMDKQKQDATWNKIWLSGHT